MRKFKIVQVVVLLVIMAAIFHKKVYCQEKNDSLFLFKCKGKTAADTAKVEIKGIGEIKAIMYNFLEVEETGWTFYYVPENKKNIPASKLSQLLTDMHIQTWKNNSRIIALYKSKLGDASIIDLRLHILIENIYMQMKAVSEKGELYEIMCFRDTNDKAHFDSLVENVKRKDCFQ